MSRYAPSTDEQQMIDRLTLAGYRVVRQRTYDRLHERVRVAEVMAGMEVERRESNERWARDAFTEQRRLADRLNAVAVAAAALGVSIQDINAALDSADCREGS